MARSRNIKPGFFKNELLVELPFEVRLLFVGLWTIADREGRLEDRSIRIRMEIFPADSVDVEAGLQALHDRGFILRYQVGADRFIQVIAWAKHQNPHHKEVQSVIPTAQKPEAFALCMDTKPEALPPMHECITSDKTGASTGFDARARASNRADSLIPDSLIPDSLEEREKPFSLHELVPVKSVHLKKPRAVKPLSRFDEFWAVYPRKVSRAAAQKAFDKLQPSDELVTSILDALSKQAASLKWRTEPEFIPHASTWINGKRWDDAIEQLGTGRGERSDTPDYLRGAI